ncbi:MAG: PPOX class F420-dependent oxidoreductase [Chloroflexi bacterium]|nr:MAG: PPOX class F420-dependent oxidoreductase [Chloroflexota bacterium]
MTSREDLLEPLIHQRAVLLTSYRRDGTPVGTAVNMAVDGDRAFVRTPHRTGKVKRLRNNPNVEIAPSTFLGKATGPAIRAQARLLSGDEAKYASGKLARKYRILQGILVPLAHRLTRSKTMHYELTPVDS